MSLRFLLEGRKGSLDKGGHEYGSIFFFFKDRSPDSQAL